MPSWESMARPDLNPAHGPGSSHSSSSCKTSAADTIPQSYAASADLHRPVTMTKPYHEQPSAASDGAFYPIYPEFYDASRMDYSAAGQATGQPHPGAWATSSEVNVSSPPGWNTFMFDAQMPYPPSSGNAQGEGTIPEPQASWNLSAQAYPALDATIGDTSSTPNPSPQYVSVEQPAMADSVSHCIKSENSTDSWHDSFGWPQPPPLGQISPAPSQSSYQTSSPASGAGAHYSRHNSCSSLPAARVAALEQTRFDARFQPVPDQAVSPGEGTLTPGGLEKDADDSYARQATGRWWDPRRQTIKTTTTTDPGAGIVSPAMTPSPRDTNTAVSSHPVGQSARNPSNQRSSKTIKSKEKSPLPARQTIKKKPAQPGIGSQGQQHRQQQGAETESQPQVKAEPLPTRPTVRHRNRDAANKCRAKTKQAVLDLESTERAMSSEHRELSATARDLRDEVLLLKNELLAHGGCDDALIQQYLTNQARKVGYGTAHAQHQQ